MVWLHALRPCILFRLSQGFNASMEPGLPTSWAAKCYPPSKLVFVVQCSFSTQIDPVILPWQVSRIHWEFGSKRPGGCHDLVILKNSFFAFVARDVGITEPRTSKGHRDLSSSLCSLWSLKPLPTGAHNPNYRAPQKVPLILGNYHIPI